MLRWHATIYYRADAGIVDVEHDFEELEDLHDIVERGPHWGTIDRIVVVYGRAHEEGLTVEKAEAL